MVIWKTFRIFVAKIKIRGYEDISIWTETAELEVLRRVIDRKPTTSVV